VELNIIEAYAFEAQTDGKTLLKVTSHYDTIETLEGMLQSGMEGDATGIRSITPNPRACPAVAAQDRCS
jgi:hypothetical protein